ncbi:hypothetical protein EVA_22641 [gut metagenome]|uniref:Uncharacterized protein n=1 Tax=gut metagenome TaxID=749906 RepID=J9BNU3_9ZZZZ
MTHGTILEESDRYRNLGNMENGRIMGRIVQTTAKSCPRRGSLPTIQNPSATHRMVISTQITASIKL